MKAVSLALMTEIEWSQLTASCSVCGLGLVCVGNAFDNERHSVIVFSVRDHAQTEKIHG